MAKIINHYIDHTLLRPDANANDIKKLCEEAMTYGFACACVNPVWVKYAKQVLKGSSTKLCSVVGFPLGAYTTWIKTKEAEYLSSLGLEEIDMVLHVGALKDGDYAQVKNDISSVVKAAPSALIKVIIETCLLTDEEKRIASLLVFDSGAHFVKTSTGFSKSGATFADVALMRKAVGINFEVKASGGIRDYKTALEMIEAGASRIGTSAGVAIVEQKNLVPGHY